MNGYRTANLIGGGSTSVAGRSVNCSRGWGINMQIGDTNEYGRVVASIENRYAVERFGIRNFGTDFAEFDADGPTEWESTKSFAKARRIWQRWIKEPTCGTAVMYRVRYYCDMHGEQFQAEELAVNHTNSMHDWMTRAAPREIPVRN